MLSRKLRTKYCIHFSFAYLSTSYLDLHQLFTWLSPRSFSEHVRQRKGGQVPSVLDSHSISSLDHPCPSCLLPQIKHELPAVSPWVLWHGLVEPLASEWDLQPFALVASFAMLDLQWWTVGFIAISPRLDGAIMKITPRYMYWITVAAQSYASLIRSSIVINVREGMLQQSNTPPVVNGNPSHPKLVAINMAWLKIKKTLKKSKLYIQVKEGSLHHLQSCDILFHFQNEGKC